MANRILLGRSTNSNLGHSSGVQGLFISRSGDDVTSCTKDQLIFNTDNVGSSTGAIDLGQFQIVPTSGTNASTSVTVSGGATATVSHSNLGTGNLLYANFEGTFVALDDFDQTINGQTYTGTTSGTLTNTGDTSVTTTVSVIKGFSTAALF